MDMERPITGASLRSTCGVATDETGFIASNGVGQIVGLDGSGVPEATVRLPVRRASARARG